MQQFLFEEPETLTLKNGKIIDARQVAGIEAGRVYTPEEVAGFLCGSARTVYDMSRASRLTIWDKEIDQRWLDFVSKKSYTLAEIAQRFTCARKTIYNLSLSGAFEFTVLRSDRRVPDWSLQKFLRENVADRAMNGELDFLKVGTLSRIPGWSILDHIERNCSEI